MSASKYQLFFGKISLRLPYGLSPCHEQDPGSCLAPPLCGRPMLGPPATKTAAPSPPPDQQPLHNRQ